MKKIFSLKRTRLKRLMMSCWSKNESGMNKKKPGKGVTRASLMKTSIMSASKGAWRLMPPCTELKFRYLVDEGIAF